MTVIKNKPLGIIVLVAAVPVIALLVGSVVNYIAISRYTNYLAIFASLAASLLAFIVWKIANIKSIVIGIVFGLLVGFSVFVVHTYGDYQNFINDVSIQTNFSDKASSTKLADEIIKSETGSSGLWGYLQYTAKNGIVVKTNGEKEGMLRKGSSAWFEIIFDASIYIIIPPILIFSFNKKLQNISKQN